MTEDDALRPVWHRERAEAEPATPVDDEEASVDRGRTVALLAALGRMQMSLDILARQQKAVEQRLARIERALAERG
jgi:hypothetical protein